MSAFPVFIERILGHEGGYSNLSSDSGGETNWGIAKRSHPELDIKNLTRNEAIEIYRKDYWLKIRGDELPKAIAFQVLDVAVNHGVVRAVEWLQRSVGLSTETDGVLGKRTMNAAKDADQAKTILTFNQIRLGFYTALSTWNTFGKGWTRRVAQNLGYAAEDLVS